MLAAWAQSIARHWDSGRLGRAPRDSPCEARLHEDIDDVDLSVGADSGFTSDARVGNSADVLVQPPSQASGASGSDSVVRQEVPGQRLAVEAATQLTEASAGDVSASLGRPKREDNDCALTTSSRPSSEQPEGVLRAVVVDSDSDSVVVVPCKSRRARNSAKLA